MNIPQSVSKVDDRCTKDSKPRKWRELCRKVLSSINDLPVPDPLAERIVRIVSKMANEITNWVSYHYRNVFLENGLDKFVYSHVYHIVWYPNGTIDCEQTARSMMISLRLSEVEKFKFLCTYCLKEEMEEMSPLLYLNNVLDYVTFRKHPLIYYWYCYFRNEMHKIRAALNCTSNLNVYVHMFQNNNVDNWSAKRYFLDLLTSDEQVRQAIWLIDKHGVIYQKAVMMKLNDVQRIHVYMERAVQIIINYARPRVSCILILSTWYESRHLITRNQLFQLFRQLLKEGIRDIILTKIWNSTDDDFKQYVVRFNSYEIVGQVLLKWKWCNDSDFIFVLLMDSSSSSKKSITTKDFFTEYSEDLLKNNKLQKLDRMLKFFLPDPQEYLSFKLNLVNSSNQVKDTCLSFYSSGDTKSLNDLVNLLAPFREEYKKNLLKSSEGIEKCISLMGSEAETIGVSVIIEDSLPDANSVTEFKKNVIFSQSAIAKLHDLLNAGCLNSVKYCIDRYLTSSEDKKLLTKKVLGDLNRTMRSILSINDESYLQTVMLWCFGNEDVVQQFRNAFNLDHTFITMLKDCVFVTYDLFLTKCCFKRKVSNLKAIDRLLNWYFQSPIMAQNYKMNLIYSYERIDMFSTLFRGNKGDPQLKIVVQWFFQNDVEEIAKFKSKFPNNKISKMI